MLVFRRKENEAFTLTPPNSPRAIEVIVLALEGNRVKIGVKAPRSVTVVRSELLAKEPKTEQGEHTGTWLVADREQAKADTGKLGLAYIEDLENAVRLADELWTRMVNRPMSPEEKQLFDDMLDALADVNFLAEVDDLLEEEQKEVAHV